MVRKLAAVVLALSVCLPGEGRAEESNPGARFGLFTECRSVDLVVGELDLAAIMIDLDQQVIENTAEIRLRTARLFDSAAPLVLGVEVGVGASAFSVSVTLHKPVRDDLGQEGYAVTWETETFGTHGDDADFIMSIVEKGIDEFLVKYLRVNEEACG